MTPKTFMHVTTAIKISSNMKISNLLIGASLIISGASAFADEVTFTVQETGTITTWSDPHFCGYDGMPACVSYQSIDDTFTLNAPSDYNYTEDSPPQESSYDPIYHYEFIVSGGQLVDYSGSFSSPYRTENYSLDASGMGGELIDTYVDRGMLASMTNVSWRLLTPEVSPVPEPANVVMLFSGIFALAMLARRRRYLNG